MNILDCNFAVITLFGAKSEQDFIDNFFDFSPKFQPDGEDTLEKGKWALKKAFDEGEHVMEWMHQLRDGTPIPCEITLCPLDYGDTEAVGDLCAIYASIIL
jgi:hypothetical protein